MRTSLYNTIWMIRSLAKIKESLRTNEARFANCYSNLLTSIIVVPLSDILDNIYQLLSHAPTCQSSVLFKAVHKHPAYLLTLELYSNKGGNPAHFLK